MGAIIGKRVVGRDAEIDEACAALDAVAPASGHALLITGEPGIGKTKLLDVVLDRARDRFRVLAEVGSELETDLPFAPLVRALGLRPDAKDPGAAALGVSLANEDATDPDLLRLQVIEGIAELLERWALEQPVVLAIEDLHWSDEATLQTLDRLARRLRHVGVLLACTARPHPRPPGLDVFEDTLADAGASMVDLTPLSQDVVVALAREILGSEPGPRLTEALRQAGGNPLFVRELLAAADPAREGDVVDLPAPGVPDSVRLTIIRNLSPLPDETVEALRAAAVLGTRFDLRPLALTLGRPEPEIAGLLEPALAAGVVTEAGDRLGFRHDLIRDAIYEDQPRAMRAALHRRVVERLRTAGLPVEAVVPHLLRGDWQGVTGATDRLAEAGRAMRHRSLPVAVELLERALDESGDGAHHEIRLDLAEALVAHGKREEAAKAIQPILDSPFDALTGSIRDRLVALAHPLRSPHATVADRLALLEALEAAGLSAAGHRAVLGIHAWLHWTSGDKDEAEQAASDALTAAIEAGDTEMAVTTEHILCRIAEGQGNHTRMIEHARATMERARRSVPAHPELELGAAAVLAIVLGSDAEERATVDRLVADALALADRTGLTAYQAALEGIASLNAERRGAWEEAIVRFGSFAASTSDAVPIGFHAMSHARIARVYVHRDELDRAAERLATAHRLLSDAGATGQVQDEMSIVHVAEAELQLALGQNEAARRAVEEAAAFIDARGIGFHHASNLPAFMTVSLSAGYPDDARAALERAERWLANATGLDAHVEGLVRWGRARLDGDVATMEEVVRWADEPRPLWEWRPRAREDAAAVLADAGRRDQAVQRLEEALALWDDAGARRDVARVRKALRDLGVRRGRGLAADRPDTGWDSLTDAEWRAVALVAEGLIYREIGERLFLSRRTVETHIQHVFLKLGVSSRRELTALLASDEGQRHLAAHR